MNLVLEPFIPCLSDGRITNASLLEIFEKGESFRDLSVNTQERTALLRLFTAIAQSALGFPKDEFQWDSFGADFHTKIPDYLEHWITHFELLGDGPRFLQTPIPADESPYPVGQLSFATATGNTATALNHREETIDPGVIARLLLVYQNFFIGGSMASKVKGNGPALKCLHTFIRGNNLKEWILRNCIDLASASKHFRNLGRPIWEKPSDAANGTQTYLGRLVPAPCNIWLADDFSGVRIDQGWQYPEFEEVPPEASATIITFGRRNQPTEKALLRAKIDKGIWRDLHAICDSRRSEEKCPLVIQSHLYEFERKIEMPIWCGELVKARDAKIVDAVESAFQVPPELLRNSGYRIYFDGVSHCEFRAKLLADAVRAFGKSMMIEKPDTSLASRAFWHAVSLKAGSLLEVVKYPRLLDKERFGISGDPWSKAVHGAAIDAYKLACPCETTRHFQAHAAGWKKLFPKRKKPTENQPTTAT